MIAHRLGVAIAASLFVSLGHAATTVSTFDDLPLPAGSHYFPNAATTFTSGAASFNHDYTDFGFPGCCWSGWVYANETDTTTAGFANQYSAYAGAGAAGSANYAVAYLGAPVATLSAPTAALGVYVTNTTYTALSMRDGDSFAKKFGGTTGNDADYLRLTITGLDAAAQATGSVDFYLADYRFADNSQDYIVDQWAYVDLSSLGVVSSLQFAMRSSDEGSFGMNTPAYFAIDNLGVAAVPEMGTYAMALMGLMGVAGVVRRRRV
jgi:hypothetical protein